eukprot:2992789-Ditylum_brightwellii.AAC.1
MKHHVHTNASKSSEFYQHSKAYMKGGEENFLSPQLAIHKFHTLKLSGRPVHWSVLDQCGWEVCIRLCCRRLCR